MEERILFLESELEARQQLAPTFLKSGLSVDAALNEKVENDLEKLKGSALYM